MEENKYKVRIGKDKMLVYHPDPSRETDMEFVRQFQEAGSSNPATLQDFFIRLAEIQKKCVHQNIPTMQIELRNIKVAEHMSEETIAFTANLYINNKKTAFVKNEGHGGNTDYQPYTQEDVPVLRQAEKHCKDLPPAIYQDSLIDGKPLTIPMNLENYIDDLLDKHLQKRDLEKFHRKMEKHQQDSILFGVPDKEYRRLKFMKPIAEMLRFEKGIEAIKKSIQEKILPNLKEGERILNTNLPSALMMIERKRLIKPRIAGDNTDGEKRKPRR